MTLCHQTLFFNVCDPPKARFAECREEMSRPPPWSLREIADPRLRGLMRQPPFPPYRLGLSPRPRRGGALNLRADVSGNDFTGHEVGGAELNARGQPTLGRRRRTLATQVLKFQERTFRCSSASIAYVGLHAAKTLWRCTPSG